METEMTAHYPVLPGFSGPWPRAFAALLSPVVYWFKRLARAHRHRREASMLAGLDRRMLADIGLTRADLRDAFSEPFWEDPTALLRERALERRIYRATLRDKHDRARHSI
jgi:uncharacterized protein YjiS (DUF1127 family)